MKDTKNHFIRVSPKCHRMASVLKAEANQDHPLTPVSQGAVIENLVEAEYKRKGLDPSKLEQS